jgi:Rad52/22 family double-strand break repair protein
MSNNDTKIIQLDGEIDVYEKEKGKYTLVTQSPVSKEQILKIFQKTPSQHVHKRPGKGGGEWDYVTGVYVKKVLNYVFGWLGDFQIIDKGTVGAQVWVQGRLTIRNTKTLERLIVKEQFGGADIKFKKGTKAPLDYANDLKAAATDALKKCASELEIASNIHGKNEFKELGAKATPPASPKAPEPPVKDTGDEGHECGAIITKAEADYSKKLFKKPLCRKCQADAKKR